MTRAKKKLQRPRCAGVGSALSVNLSPRWMQRSHYNAIVKADSKSRCQLS
ncbi:hypothetical protein IQ230_11970 [Gloeocapsopsis crepidinum LEGE 06123]|uniref:Uncharacterized protein n=1 Tax=Gloeocapsopsis crepidinum LEGE 06123 TaxID=588587 RepID=A0ABR9US13_9CHRO|nr:hypothetical protein [Gloeocapsopsis crepidinum]MBE9191057.1 hypothetical protein [Gloeocapsopsis crepidinum LEGE 06123]